MEAYHSNPELKAQFVALITAHEAADEIVQGTYWNDGRGCAVGCSIDSLNRITGERYSHDSHVAYEALIGVPRILARLEDGIFEGLPLDVAKTWPRRFAEAIRPGADLSGVWTCFAVWLLTDAEHGVIRFAKNKRQRTAIQAVAELYSRQIAGETISKNAWQSAADAADAAYADAAYDAYAAYAAADAAYAAYAAYDAYAAACAAAYAAAAADADAAKQQARIVQADKLIALLEAA